ncbi:MAG: deoxyribose-phosphate aldolase [Ruminiclostridium sp.]|nr:deoxyribose-phosphate aldolase [Ruminiclostridium sp.]
MNNKDIFRYVDHTKLSATATSDEILTLCGEAVKYGTASVCIPPCYIELAKKEYPSLNICTVIGFPLGYCTTETKVFETKDAVAKGADEIDMVINVGMVKNKQYDKVLEEIKAVKEACGGKLLKVIIEACYLTDDEKIMEFSMRAFLNSPIQISSNL